MRFLVVLCLLLSAFPAHATLLEECQNPATENKKRSANVLLKALDFTTCKELDKAKDNIRWLYIGDEKNFDGSLIRYLTNLRSVDIFQSGLRDISWLANLENLERVKLKANPIVDITPLANLRELHTLNLSATNITSLAPLAGLSRLENLSVDFCHNLHDISALVHMKSLRILEMYGRNEVKDISPIAALENLIHLDIVWVHFENELPFKILAQLPQLKVLKMGDQHIPTLKYLSHLPALEVLSIMNANVIELYEIGELKSLLALSVKGNRIRDVSALANAEKLEVLKLNRNEVADVSALKDHPALRKIELEYNPVFNPENRTEANCPTVGENKAVTKFCARKRRAH